MFKAPTMTCAGVICVDRESFGVEGESKSLETIQKPCFPREVAHFSCTQPTPFRKARNHSLQPRSRPVVNHLSL